MRFVRAIWKFLVGVKDALALVLLLIFFGGLYMALSGGPKPVGEGVLALNLNGRIVEQPSEPSTTEILSGRTGMLHEYRRRDLIAMLVHAAADERVKAVTIDLDGFLGGGETTLADVGAAIDQVRAAHKPVIAYASGYTDDGYQLAAHASDVWLNPLGALAMTGPGGNNLYFKGLMDKLGITANVYRVGTYKSAVEPFTRSDMSPAAKENAAALYGALLEAWREDVVRARPKAKAGLDAYLKSPAAALGVAVNPAAGSEAAVPTPLANVLAAPSLADGAMKLGLVDHVGTQAMLDETLRKLGGDDKKARGGYKTILLSSYLADTVKADSSGNIAVVTIAGEIVDGKAGPGTAGGETIVRQIEQGLADDRVKALVVRIDSPGGSVAASERIRQAILAAKAKKLPVVVSMGDVAASGGYWVATPADTVFAEPGTITGSIGVFGILPSFQGTLAKLGIGADGVKTTPLAGEPDLLKGPSPEAGALVQAGVDQIYRTFLTIVGQSRHKAPAEIDRIAQGRVWDGGSARQLGLVDRFGGIDEAIALAGEKAGIAAGDRKIRYLDHGLGLRASLVALLSGDDDEAGASTDALASLSPAPEAQVMAALAELHQVMGGPTMQVRCLECPSTGPVRASAADRGWWATAMARLLG